MTAQDGQRTPSFAAVLPLLCFKPTLSRYRWPRFASAPRSIIEQLINDDTKRYHQGVICPRRDAQSVVVRACHLFSCTEAAHDLHDTHHGVRTKNKSASCICHHHRWPFNEWATNGHPNSFQGIQRAMHTAMIIATCKAEYSQT